MRVAVTGGVAEGKSTVLGYLREMGYTTASGDAFARDCFLEPEIQSALADLLETEPPVTPNQLRALLATSAPIRRAVNALMHPSIVRRILASPAAFVEVPLLIEACLHPLFDQVWVVTCGPEEQLKRLTERVGANTAISLISSQLPTFAKTPFGDVVIRTNQSPETVKRNICDEAGRVVFG